ncbi:hypothetical protein ACFX1R_027154 [Malus domestica]
MNCTDLLDADFKGPTFTWRGTRNGVLIQKHIDRGLFNNFWRKLWPNTIAIHRTLLGSNHCPIIIQREPDNPKGKMRFRFEAF